MIYDVGYNFNELDLSERVHTFLLGESADYEMSLVDALIDCESPLEQLFSLILIKSGILTILKFNPKVDVVAIEKQYELVANGNKYRADFFMPVQYNHKNESVIINFVIEIDGHDFHQKTKKQVERDNQRTRDLQIAGYEVVRFSGTEIYHKPYQAVGTLISLILSKANK